MRHGGVRAPMGLLPRPGGAGSNLSIYYNVAGHYDSLYVGVVGLSWV